MNEDFDLAKVRFDIVGTLDACSGARSRTGRLRISLG